MKKNLFRNLKMIITCSMLLLSTVAFSQSRQLSGTVVDTSGEGIPGVNVIVKGTVTGTVTDIDGKYSLKVDDNPNLTIQFSFIGYKALEQQLSNQSVINVTLEQDAIGLDEVVAVGYGVQRKSDLTGSIASVSSDQMKEIPLSRVDQALQGKIAGVNISTTDGSPGGNVKIRIRGANSINGGNQPLIVVDGFLGGDLKTINPSDIESIEVLKDASATAVYGSRGANGVVLVTTKQGSKGKTEVTFSSYASAHEKMNSVDILAAHEYAQILNERAAIFNQPALFSAQEIEEFKQTGGTDWEEEIYRDYALLHNSQLSVAGGSEKIKYYLSANIVDQNGLIHNNDYKRFGLKASIDAELNDWITVGFNAIGNKETKHGMNFNGYWGNPVDNALRFPNTTPVYNEDGTYCNDTPIPSVGLYNPVATVMEPRRLAITYNALINAYAKFKLSDDLSFKTSVGSNTIVKNGNSFSPLTTLNGFNSGKNNASVSNSISSNWQNTNTLNYLKTINDIHRLNGTLVFEQQHTEYRSNNSSVRNFPTEALGYNKLGLGEERNTIDSGHNESNILSFMGRINYSFMDRYLFTVTYRADGSSKFGEDNKWGYFPSASFAWRLSEESFIKEMNVFSNLKFRTSYGETGSQATGAYSSLTKLNTGMGYPLNGISQTIGIGPGSNGNSDLKWEKTGQINLGIDAGFFDNRLSFVLDLYKKTTKDLLLDDPLPRYTGHSSIRRNMGEVENKGIEFLLSGSPCVNNFKWDVSFNISSNKSRISEFGNSGYKIIDEYILKQGEELGTFYGYKYLGVWKSNEAEEAAKFGSAPGDSKYYDLDNNNAINEDDKVIIGNGQPDFVWGLNNNFSYKNFDLSAEINGVQGNQILNVTRYWLNRSIRAAEMVNYYRPDNQDTNVPGFSNTEKDYNTPNSRWLEDGSFVRLRNVTLGYTFNEDLLKKVKLSSARVYFSGQNLLTITDYSGFDPELSSTGNSDTKVGLDASPYPSAKIYTIGLDIKF
ncbi:TonB-dependent receptor [Puteibacter caeruleilacunae]|nr:TonB-dependent receptor [Puteibacter caeruleilacunae]